MGSVILSGAQIGENCLVGAGSLVTQGMVIPPCSVVMGAPAKIVKTLGPGGIEKIRINGAVYEEMAARYLSELTPVEGVY